MEIIKKTKWREQSVEIFDSWERLETLCDETNLMQQTEIERPLFLNLIKYPIYPSSPLRQDMTQGQFF